MCAATPPPSPRHLSDNGAFSNCSRRDQDPRRPDRRRAAANAMHQVRLSGMPALRRSDRRRRGRHQPVPARRHRRRAPHFGADRPAGHPDQPGQRLRAPARGRLHRRTAVHRLHPVHPGLPGRRDPRRGQADAHHPAEPVHRLRPVRGALPGRLHRDVPGHRRATGWDAWTRQQADAARERHDFRSHAPAARARGKRRAAGRQGGRQDARSDRGSGQHAGRAGRERAQARHHRRRDRTRAAEGRPTPPPPPKTDR